MNINHPHELATWPTLNVGDSILLRSRTGTTHTIATVARILPAIDGDGPGLTDTQGNSYRHYYFAVDHTNSAQEISDSIDALATFLEKISVQLLGATAIDDIDDAG